MRLTGRRCAALLTVKTPSSPDLDRVRTGWARGWCLVACAAALVLSAPAHAAAPGKVPSLAAAKAPASKPPEAAKGQTEEPAKAPAEPAPPAAIPVPLVIRGTEQAHLALQRLAEASEPEQLPPDVGARLEAAQQVVSGLEPQLAPERLARLSEREVVEVKQELQRQDAALARWDEKLEAAVRATSASKEELERIQNVWELTRDGARAEAAPAVVTERIESVLQEVREAAPRIRERLEALVRLQDQVARLRNRIADGAAGVRRTEQALSAQLFEMESAPLWKAWSRAARGEGLRHQLATTVDRHWRAVTAYLSEEPEILMAGTAMLLALAGLMFPLRARIRARAAEEPALRLPERVLRRPFSAALLLSLLGAGLLYEGAPQFLKELAILLALIPFLRVMAGILSTDLMRPLYAFGAILAVERLGLLARETSLLARLILLAVTGGMLAILLQGLGRRGWVGKVASGRWGRAVAVAAYAAAALLVAAIAANVIGNVTLANRLTSGTISSAVMAILFAGAVMIVESLLAAGVHLRAARRIPAVERHGDLVAGTLSTWVRWAAVALWVYYAKRLFGIWTPVLDAVVALLSKRLQVGGLDISLGDVAAFAVTLWVAVMLSRLLRFLLDEVVLPQMALPRGVPAAVSRTVQYLAVAVGLYFAVLASGMETTRFALLAGTLAVGIGFGLQNVVNNFVSGLILLYERPVQVGDFVEVSSQVGQVRRIGIRSSTIHTAQGAEVIVPNASLISAEVVNWTLSDRMRRVEVPVGVAYGSDPEQVRRILLAAVGGRPEIPATPAPEALLVGFGQSSLDFQLRFWVLRFEDAQVVGSEVRIAVLRGLAAAGIEIPFPQRDLHLRSVDPGVAGLLPGGRPPGD
jgi:small-conductance mechanosensitive channel